jgi:hypothetical protein
MTTLQTPPASAPAPAPAAARAAGIWRQLLADRRFLLVVVVLGLAAAGLNAATQRLKLHFRKLPVPMRQEFGDAMPRVIGNWVQVARDDTLDPETLSALGTDRFLFCSYVNASALGRTPADLQRELVEGKTVMQQKETIHRLSQSHPAAVVQVGLTYYTGKADTVAHVAERCWVGGGFDPMNPATEDWGLGRDLRVRTIGFQSQVYEKEVHLVAYVFHANGHYEPNSLRVRAMLQDLFQRYGYYAKIEMSCPTRDREAATRSIKDLMVQALPYVEQALPDWEHYRALR